MGGQRQRSGKSPTLSSWLLAIRPRTLPAAASPVIVGTAAATADHLFQPIAAATAFVGAILLQIGVNLANDYFDYTRGVDTEERLGPIRVTQSGLIPPAKVRTGMLLVFLLAAAAGFYLATQAGWVIILMGTASIVAALIYSGGPFPIASHGLGDFFAFFFFGPIAVCGTYFVQALHLNLTSVLLSLPVGFLVASILVVNNLRDIPTDVKVGKRTLAVILGVDATRAEFKLLLVSAYIFPLLLVAVGLISPSGILPLLSAPRALRLIRSVSVLSGNGLNQALAETAKLTLIFSLLLAVGLLVPLFRF